MSCAEVLGQLKDVEAGHPPAPDVEAELVRRGWAQRTAAAGDPAAGAELRTLLVDLRAERTALAAQLRSAPPDPAAALKTRLREVEASERETRKAILELAELPAHSTTSLTLTFAGRDLVGELESRLGRVADLPIDTFLERIETLRSALGTVAREAGAMLGRLSRSSFVAEQDLRAAVIGLATLPEPQRQEGAFLSLTGILDGNVPEACVALVAEALVSAGTFTLADASAFGALATKVRRHCPSVVDACHATSLVWGHLPDQRERLVEDAVRSASGWRPGVLAPAVLLVDAGMGHACGLVPELEVQVGALEKDPVSVRWTAAFLAMADSPVDRWREVCTWLRQYGTEGIAPAAAMLTMIDAPPSELLDDLRLASVAVRAAGLSLHAVENLALGVKLLLEVAQGQHVTLPQAGSLRKLSAPATFAPLPLARFSPRFVQAVSTYHAATLHPQVVLRTRTHPLHSHNVYG